VNTQTAAPPVPCDYLDGTTTRRRRVTLRVEDGHAVIEGEDISRREPLGRVRVSERMGSAPRLVSFPDGAFCEVRDHGALDALLGATGFRESFVVRIQARWTWVAGALAAMVALVAAAYVFVLPWGAEIAAAHVPQSAMKTLSDQTLEALEGRFFEPSTLPEDRRTALAQKFARMITPDGDKVAHELVFRKSPVIGPNALALPSGTIIVTDELVALAASDDEILAVLSHELGHVQRRHGVRKALQSTVVGLVATWYLGDLSSLAAAIPAALLDARYSRDMEAEADAYGARMLRANSLSPSLLAMMLERLESSRKSDDADAKKDGKDDGDGLRGYLRSHPATEERIRALRRPTSD
jgi:Zn-dependent protease with chaperone function